MGCFSDHHHLKPLRGSAARKREYKAPPARCPLDAACRGWRGRGLRGARRERTRTFGLNVLPSPRSAKGASKIARPSPKVAHAPSQRLVAVDPKLDPGWGARGRRGGRVFGIARGRVGRPTSRFASRARASPLSTNPQVWRPDSLPLFSCPSSSCLQNTKLSNNHA